MRSKLVYIKKKRSKYAVKYENIFVISASQSLFIFSLKQTHWLSSLARKSRLASTFFAEARKWPRYKAQMMPELLLHEKKKLRESLTTLLKSHIKQVILFCDHKDLVTIMNEVGNHDLKSAVARLTAKVNSWVDNQIPQSRFQLRNKTIDNFV